MSNRLLDIVHASAADLLAKHTAASTEDTPIHEPSEPQIPALTASAMLPVDTLLEVASNAVYVVYASKGQILKIDTISASASRWDRRGVVKDLGLLGDAVAGVRVVEVDSEKMAVELARVLGELFGGLFAVTPGVGTGREKTKRGRRKVSKSSKRGRVEVTPVDDDASRVVVTDGGETEGDQDGGYISTYAAAALGVGKG